jgi:hypothetical protein
MAPLSPSIWLSSQRRRANTNTGSLRVSTLRPALALHTAVPPHSPSDRPPSPAVLWGAVHGFGFCVVVVLCLLMGLLLKKRKFYYLPESGASMLLGNPRARTHARTSALPHAHSHSLPCTLPSLCAVLWTGFVIGGFISLFGETEALRIVFNPFVFFFVLLPPIIFEAGFTLDQKSFFKNLGNECTYTYTRMLA